jgi:uncharacterized protein YebE (UPF0316 family)
MFALILHDSLVYSWVILPLLIFLARITDVSLGTVRLIFVSRGFKYLAPLAGFFEVLIWILVIGQIMRNLSNPVCYLAYAGGFATGNFVGLLIAERLSLGVVTVRVITTNHLDGFVGALKERHFGVTSIEGQGANGPVRVIFTIVPRREVEQVVQLIKQFSPNAFYSIEEVGHVERGVFPIRKNWRDLSFLRLVRPFRIGK